MNTLTDEALAGLMPAARQAALGDLSGAAVHEINNWLFGILAQIELLLMEPTLDAATEERLRTIADTGAGLKQMLRRFGAAVRADGLGEAPLQAEVRSVLGLPGFAGASFDEPPAPVEAAGDPATVAEIVFCGLIGLVGTAPAVELRADDAEALIEARPTREGRPRADGGLGLAVAGALARGLGGSLAIADDGSLRLSLPLV